MATTYSVGLEFSAKTQQLDQVVSKLQSFDRTADKLKGKNPFQGVERGARGAGDAAARAGKQAEAAAGGFDKLSKAVGGLVSAAALLAAGKFVIGKTAELETQTRSIQVLTGSLKEAKTVIGQLQEFAAVTPFTSTDLIETAKRLKAFGVDTEKLVDTTKRLGDVAGATGAELSGIATAYGQIQAKGRLQGEELLQLQERGINLQSELQKMYGMTGDEFREALEKGKFSAQAVELALRRLTDTGGKYANGAIAQSDTLNGKFSTLQDGIDSLARRIGQVLMPVLKGVLDYANLVVDAVNRALAAGRGGAFSRNIAVAGNQITFGATSQGVDTIEQLLGQITPQANKVGIEQNLQVLRQAQTALRRIPANDPNGGRAVALQGQILQMLNQNLEALKKATNGVAAAVEAPSVPALLGGTGKDKKGSKKKAPTGRIIEYLTGDRSHAGYRADHGGSNYHEHLAFETQQQTQLAMKALQAAGIKIGSTTGGRHAPGSYHYSGQAFDVPASQVPVGQEQALSQLVRSVLAKAGFEGSGIGGDSGGHINQILDEYANKLAESFQQGQQLTTEFTRQNELLLTGTEEARRRLEIQYQFQDNEQQIAELMDAGQQKELQALNEKLKAAELQKLENELLVEKAQLLESALRPIADENEMLEARLAGTEKELEVRRQIAALTNAGMDGAAATGMVQRNQQLKEQVAQVDAQKQLWADIYGAVANQLQGSIRGLIDGTKEWGDVLSDVLGQLGNLFISAAFNSIGGALKLPGFAGGGYTGDGARSGGLDGKGGFMAMLHPQEVVTDLFGASRDAISSTRITSMEGGFNADEATGTGEAVASTRASLRETERIRENRMQMMTRQLEADRRYERESIERMASTPGNLNVRYESQVINNVEYVTREQAERMSTQSALRGRELAIGALQNSVKTRKRVGI